MRAKGRKPRRAVSGGVGDRRALDVGVAFGTNSLTLTVQHREGDRRYAQKPILYGKMPDIIRPAISTISACATGSCFIERAAPCGTYLATPSHSCVVISFTEADTDVT